MELTHVVVFLDRGVMSLDFRFVWLLVVLEEDLRHHQRGHLQILTVLQVNVGQGSQLLEIVKGL